MTPRRSELGFLIILLFFLVDFPWATFLKGPGGVWRHVARRGGRLETKLDLDRDSASVPGSRTLPRRFKWNHEDLNIKEIQARLPVETISSCGCANIESHLILGWGSCFLCWNPLGNSIALKLHLYIRQDISFFGNITWTHNQLNFSMIKNLKMHHLPIWGSLIGS